MPQSISINILLWPHTKSNTIKIDQPLLNKQMSWQIFIVVLNYHFSLYAKRVSQVKISVGNKNFDDVELFIPSKIFFVHTLSIDPFPLYPFTQYPHSTCQFHLCENIHQACHLQGSNVTVKVVLRFSSSFHCWLTILERAFPVSLPPSSFLTDFSSVAATFLSCNRITCIAILNIQLTRTQTERTPTHVERLSRPGRVTWFLPARRPCIGSLAQHEAQ